MNSLNFFYLNLARTQLHKIGILTVSHLSTELDPPSSFSEGCWLDKGKLHYVAKRCLVGAFIHEAAHLALIPKRQWKNIAPGDFDGQGIEDPFAGGGELAAEAWGYCFAIAARIPVEAAIHSNTKIATVGGGITEEVTEEYLAETHAQSNRHGYFGELSKAEFQIAHSLLAGRHLGIALLSLSGMTTQKGFPKLTRWLWGNQDSKFDFKKVLGEVEL
jgi:hypothetical protein